MSTKIDYEAIGKAFVLLCSTFAGAYAIPQGAGGLPASTDKPKADTTAGSASTPEAPKVEAEAGPAEGNSQGLDAAAFTKVGLDFANSNKPHSGNALKAILKEFGVERLGVVPVEQYDAFLEKIEEAKLA